MVNKERDIEYLSHEDALEFQTSRIRELMIGTWQKAPGFLARLDDSGVAAEEFQNPADISKFPILKKSDLPGIQSGEPPFGGLITVSPGRLRRIYS
jgi:phenylacetate-coenzyme A ligase PaaK-like adenylate-forming protein